MSDGFTKLFHSITTSTVWMQPDNVRLIWITMLALADKDGIVRASVPGLAHVARVELAATEAALEILGAPDPYSRTPENDGRRIEPVDGGWLIINHAKYRNCRDNDDRREYERTRKREQRDRLKREQEGSPGPSGTSPTIPGLSAHTEAEAEAEADTELRKDKDSTEPASPPLVPVITLPLNTGAEYPVYQALVDEWQALYPAVDVMQELRKMRAWADANKSKRKTKAGIKRFCVNWLNKAQDSGGARPPRGTSPGHPSGGGSIGETLR